MNSDTGHFGFVLIDKLLKEDSLMFNITKMAPVVLRRFLECECVNFTVMSDSMHPKIKVGDVVKICPIVNELKRGDVVVFQKGKKLVIHRIKRLIGKWAIIQGDNSRGCEVVQLKSLVGVCAEK